MANEPEKFVVFQTGAAVALKDTTGSVFGASGASHAIGLVPDPGSSAGTTRALFEDGTFKVTPAPTPTRAGDIIYWNGTAWVTLAGNNSGTSILQENSSGVPSWTTATVFTAPTYQSFLSGSGNYTPTSGSVTRIKVRMCAGGGGGAAATTNNGSNGGDTSFASWTAIHGNGGSGESGGIGGTSGTNGTGTLIVRLAGGNGSGGGSTGIAGESGGGMGGSNYFGGAGGGGPGNGNNGTSAASNTGAGGGGGGSQSTTSGGGGGAGEYVEFVVSSPGTIAYSVGGGGALGAAGTHSGGNGGSGVILIEEFYF